MQICQVPDELILSPVVYPPHNSTNIERFFVSYAREHFSQAPGDWHYIPITWTNVHCWENKTERRVGYRASPKSQRWVDQNIDPNKKYFTVVQGDDGIFEEIPNNIVVFGAGGTGDIPIPLTCMPHKPSNLPRHLLAYFAGQQKAGGPVLTGKHRSESSWDPVGPGYQCRTKTIEAFHNKPNCIVVDQHATSVANVQRFVSGLCSTKFALAPRGYGKTSFRMYEAIQLGAIPVYIFDDPWVPYQDKLNWDEFSVFCHVDDVGGLYDRLVGINEESIWSMQRNLAKVYDEFFSLEGTSKQILRYLHEDWVNELVGLPKQR